VPDVVKFNTVAKMLAKYQAVLVDTGLSHVAAAFRSADMVLPREIGGAMVQSHDD